MIKKLLYIGILFLLAGNTSLSQQQGIHTNFLMNSYYYNPAIAGSTPHSRLNIGARKQWVGFQGAPFSFNASFQGSIHNKGKFGLGGSVFVENMGLTNKVGVYFNYAQQFRLFNDVKLGLGIRPGYIQYSAQLYKAHLADKGDQTLSGNTYSGGAFDIGMGFNLYSPQFFFMVSFNHLLREAIQFAPYNANLAMHFNAIAGYNIQLKNKNIVLQPSLMLKYVKPVPLQLVAMFKATFQDKYFAGILMRTNDAFGIVLGIKIKKMMWLSYGFDYTVNKLARYQYGSHEISLSFIINRKKKTLTEKDKQLNNSIMNKNKRELNN